MKNNVWWTNWSTVAFKPSLWWRIKFLFFPHDIVFCWGEDTWFTVGLNDQTFFSIGGVPPDQRNRAGMINGKTT